MKTLITRVKTVYSDGVNVNSSANWAGAIIVLRYDLGHDGRDERAYDLGNGDGDV